MIVSLKGAYGLDVDILQYLPDDPENDGVWVRLMVGPDGSPGEESFDLLVCTPKWLQQKVESDGPQIGLHHLIVYPFDLTRAVDYLRKRIESLQVADWDEAGSMLSKIGCWEFDGYRE